MEIFYSLIGDHIIQVISQSQVCMGFMHKYFPMMDPPSRQADLIIYLKEGYGIPFYNYNVAITQEEDAILFRRADYLIEAKTDYGYAVISVHNELALKHAFMNLYSSYVVHHRWGLLIHSSCVMEKGAAYLFAGHSGAGKSTAAKLSYPRELLSDEATIVKISSEQITVYNSPFRSELNRTGLEQAGPLAGIYLLKQSLHNHVVRLSRSNGFLELMDKVFYWSPSPTGNVSILQLLQQMVKHVAVSELHFQKNDTFWELISS
ncbi:hypothetical protein BC351_27535 [Paenibacillus ferrarius]|uniref:Phosphoenolpyruvate carboxykinase n=1 Tax=Paenibacillus ferrarius TaxID=1469647 RepID=A0A1V4HIV6_9BACL|nr:hypothetical protein [Paenibacillus ferrarius]OPH56697.1 hypothetical protein BC351_27535 [Paenibacillus ferrarius]